MLLCQNFWSQSDDYITPSKLFWGKWPEHIFQVFLSRHSDRPSSYVLGSMGDSVFMISLDVVHLRGRVISLSVFYLSDMSSYFSGNVVNIQTGQWVGKQSGLGAGMDSFYEYLLKSYILFGEKEDYKMFKASYESIQNHLRRGYV